MWGLFGGHIEANENAREAAIREVEEELTCRLSHPNMKLLVAARQIEGKVYSLFYYSLQDELENAVLTEGQRFDFFWPSQIHQGSLETKNIVPHHRQWILNYLDGKLTS